MTVFLRYQKPTVMMYPHGSSMSEGRFGDFPRFAENQSFFANVRLLIGESAVQILHDRFGTGVHMKLFVNVTNVAVKCAGADAQVVHNFFVTKSLGELI